jgi:hypothetical protein
MFGTRKNLNYSIIKVRPGAWIGVAGKNGELAEWLKAAVC